MRERTQSQGVPAWDRSAGTRPALALVALEEVPQRLERGLARHLRDAGGERDALRAGLHAVRGLAAIVDAARKHERMQALGGVHLPGGMVVVEPRLRDGRRPDERRRLAHLRADFQAAPAGHAGGEDVVDLLVL